jgi:hypothetical protein
MHTPRKNNTQQRLLEDAVGELPVGASLAERRDFALRHNPKLAQSSLKKLISELGVLTHPRVRENFMQVIGHAQAVSKDGDPRFYNEALKAARRIKRGDPLPRYEMRQTDIEL